MSVTSPGRIGTALSVATFALSLTAAPARAAGSAPPSPPDTAPMARTLHPTQRAVTLKPTTIRRNGLTMTVGGGTGATTAPTADELASIRATVAPAATRKTASCQTWYQYEYVHPWWSERQVGKFCWGIGRQVWVKSYPGRDPYPITAGYHYCHEGWSAAGYSLETRYCDIVRVVNSHFYGGYYRQNWDRYTVSFGYGLATLHVSNNMHANVFPSGALTFHY